MYTSMMRKALLSGGSQVKSIMSDLMAGTGYCDFFVIGDSNAGNDDDANARGYSGGLWESLAIDKGVNEYGTQFAEFGASSLTYLKGGAPVSSNFGLASIIDATTYGTNWSRNFNGTIPRSALVADIWKRGLKAPGVDKEAAYLESTSTQSYLTSWMKFDHNASVPTALSCRHAATFRMVVVGGINQSNAVIQTWVYADVSGPAASAQSNTNVFNATSTPVIQIIDKSWAADASRLRQAATHTSNTSGKGPVMALMRSVFRSGTPGFAVTNLHAHGGATTTTIAASLSEATGCGSITLSTYFKQAIERQTTAGATKKRVVVWLNMGINDGTATCTANYVNNALAIVAQCKAGWATAGGVASDLGIVCSVSHPTSTFSPTGANDNALVGLASDPVVTYVNINPAGTTWTSYYGPVTQAHLNVAGYRFVANTALQAITA
jgi:hypothetical protein